MGTEYMPSDSRLPGRGRTFPVHLQCPPALAKSFPSPARLGRFLFFTHSGSARDARVAGALRSCPSDPPSSLPQACRLQNAEVQQCSSAQVQTRPDQSVPPTATLRTDPTSQRPASTAETLIPELDHLPPTKNPPQNFRARHLPPPPTPPGRTRYYHATAQHCSPRTDLHLPPLTKIPSSPQPNTAATIEDPDRLHRVLSWCERASVREKKAKRAVFVCRARGGSNKLGTPYQKRTSRGQTHQNHRDTIRRDRTKDGKQPALRPPRPKP